MTGDGERIAEAALALVGCPFRLHGRDPASGLDCVGLVALALEATGARTVAPRGYALRNLGVETWLPFAGQAGLAPAQDEVRAGDILLITLGFAQHHLAIAIDGQSVVHAHAGLRRVVCQPRDPTWQISARWRVPSPCEG